jgi:hypothetical protein
MRGKRQNGEIATLSFSFVVKGIKAARGMVKQGM